ncbi:MAG TPA: dihydrodipicolinate reductase C-terminal domain-containing protein [Microbacteriaceae bacterium]|nr:dihydrodipicolinate reductase C-terminal domain-containing protein [Microbacteriaceae bacterium]
MRVAIVGATGRLGSLAARLVQDAPDLELHAAVGSADSLDAVNGADVIFDATRLEVSRRVVEHAVNALIPVVVGTSGWTAQRIAELGTVHSPVCVIPNFSLGSVLGSAIAALAAPFFDTVDVVETHHAGKLDSPSGTAVRTAELIADARRRVGLEGAVPGAGQDARGQLVAGVPVHSLRQAGVVAEQVVTLGRLGESLRIEHVTTSSESYAEGILLALRSAPDLRGIVVGLDALLDLPGLS